jgi:hypothetical protein
VVSPLQDYQDAASNEQQADEDDQHVALKSFESHGMSAFPARG